MKLPKLGAVEFICHRLLPQGFDLKTVAVTLKADGWYVTFSLPDKSVPEPPVVEVEPTEANSIGVDAGLQYFIACSDGTTKQPPKFCRQAEQKLANLQAKWAAKAKGAKVCRKLNERIAKQLHQRIARQRKEWHFETAGELPDKAEVVFVEDLQVVNMVRRVQSKPGEDGAYLPNSQAAKSGLNKSFADAGIAGFLNHVLPYKAAKAGKRVVKVNPAGTSQHWAMCLNRVAKELSERWHSCPHCGVSMPRDVNSGVLIKKVGLGHRLPIKLTIKRESGATRRPSQRRTA